MSEEHSSLATPEFVERLRSGNAEAKREVVRAYLPQIVRTARGAGLRPEEAEDRFKQLETDFRKEHGLDSQDTASGTGVVDQSDADFMAAEGI